jgi:hypothetical protein
MPSGPDRSCSHGRGDRTLPEVRCHSHFAQCTAPSDTPRGRLFRSIHSRAHAASGSSTAARAATSGTCARLPAASPADRMDSSPHFKSGSHPESRLGFTTTSRFRTRFHSSCEFGWIWSAPSSSSCDTSA